MLNFCVFTFIIYAVAGSVKAILFPSGKRQYKNVRATACAGNNSRLISKQSERSNPKVTAACRIRATDCRKTPVSKPNNITPINQKRSKIKQNKAA